MLTNQTGRTPAERVRLFDLRPNTPFHTAIQFWLSGVIEPDALVEYLIQFAYRQHELLQAHCPVIPPELAEVGDLAPVMAQFRAGWEAGDE